MSAEDSHSPAQPASASGPEKAGAPPFYVTTPIYYVNDYPHIGHIYTTLVVDTIARYRRLRGDDVYMLTGTDEHGQKIEKAAAKLEIAPIALADRVVERYHAIWHRLGIAHDDFIRTTEERHEQGVRQIIERLFAAGDLYLNHHEGLYCVACETFYTEKELDQPGNRCRDHGTPCEFRSEQNIFFRLSKYEQPLLELYRRQPDFVAPETRRNEVQQFVSEGLRDLSVSRTNVAWGIAFPGNPGHTVYVWLDALTNYITALGYGSEPAPLFERFWRSEGRRIHVVGKDIVRFHAVYWPAFLMAAGLPLPTQVVAHGWWLRDGHKISKSVGNVVQPDHLIEQFGGDALRYFLLREMVFGQDGVFSDEGFIDRFNSDLANDLGNTLSRVITVSRKAFADHLPPRRGEALRAGAEAAIADYRRAMDAFAFQDALRALWRLLQETNQYLVQNEPWKKLADPANLDAVAEVLWASGEAVRLVATALLPILPESAPALLAALQVPVPAELEVSLRWGGLPVGAPLPPVTPQFPRIDKKLYLSEVIAASVSARPASPAPSKPSAKAQKDPVMTEPAKTEPATTEPAAAPVASAPAAPAEAPAETPKITIDQFMAVDLRTATVLEAERVPKSDKLIKLSVDAGEGAPRTLVAGIGKQYAPEALIGRQVVIVANLQPAKLMGIHSNGMVLAASRDGLPILLHPEVEVPNGTRVR
jgi:methionyl-tRNA synthetase